MCIYVGLLVHVAPAHDLAAVVVGKVSPLLAGRWAAQTGSSWRTVRRSASSASPGQCRGGWD
uniref:Uncharacterized protein n=1 Tax=Anguilla anguilla TaxID=7936 RepID=A0A0E9W2G9_ANGAN